MGKFLIYFFIILSLLTQNVYGNTSIGVENSTDFLIEDDTNINNNEEKENTLKLEENIEENVIKYKYDYAKYGVDFTEIKKSWLKLNNDLRDNLGKDNYSYDSKLDETAQEWSEVMLNRSSASHKRNLYDSYYNYKKITNWFKNREIQFKNVNRATFSESIGYGNYTCSQNDCTQEISSSVKRVYDRYMEEKNKAYQPHYKAMIKTEFQKIGLGVAIKELGKNRFEFYLTVHYGTEIL